VEWYFNGARMNRFGEQLVLQNVTSANSGAYHARIYSNGGFCNDSTSNVASLHVWPSAGFQTQPSDVQACVGSRITFTAVANQSIDYIEWTRNGTVIPGATSLTLEWGPVTAADSNAVFRCRIAEEVCGTVATSRSALVTLRTDPAAEAYSHFLTSITAAEIVRSSMLRNENPRLAAVLTAIGIVAARNPNMNAQQLSDFVSQYDTVLRAQHAGDANLIRSMNFHTAVRFQTPITSIVGVDADVGEAVLRRLGLSLGDSTRERNLVKLQAARSLRLAVSDAFATVLADTFAHKDASDAVNPLVAPAAAAYLRANGIEPYPTAQTVRANHPEVLRALSFVPATPEAYEAERASNFANVRARISSELNSVRSLINAEITQLQQYSAQYPTLQSTFNAARTPGVLDAARADQAANLVELNRLRSGLSFATASMARDGALAVEARVLREFSNTQIRFADSAVATASTALQGAGTIVGGIGSFFTGPGGIISGVGYITSGVGVLLPLVIPEEPGPPSPFQQVADRITQLQTQLEDVRVTMLSRFDRVDAQLQVLYSQVTGGFDAMAQYFEQQSADLRGIQRGLAEAQSNMNRFEANLYGMLTDGFSFPFYETMDEGLNYRETFGKALTYVKYYEDYEGRFYTAATSHAEGELFAGPLSENLPYSGQGLATLQGRPSGYVVNYLRTYPGAYLGLPNLSNSRLVNPTHWALAADAYSQVARESPWYFARVNADRLATVRSRGDSAQAAMHAARNSVLYAGLNDEWLTHARNLNDVVTTWAGSHVPGVNLWDGTSQGVPHVPANFNNRMTRYAQVCSGTFPVNGTLVEPGFGSNVAWDILPPEYKLAMHLGLSGRAESNYAFSYRVRGAATLTNGQWQFESNGVVRKADVDVELWHVPTTQTQCALDSGGMMHFIAPGANAQRVATRRFSLTFGPTNQGVEANPIGTFWNRWRGTNTNGTLLTVDPIYNNFLVSQSTDTVCCVVGRTDRCWTAQTIVDPTGLAAVRAQINDSLRNHQRSFLNQVITALSGGADPWDLRGYADLMTLHVRLMDMYLSLGAPESHALSDVIRGVLRGNEMGIDTPNAIAYFTAQRNAIEDTAGAPASVSPPNVLSAFLPRNNNLNVELTALFANSTEEFTPFMKWTRRSLSHLNATRFTLARNDQYVVAPGQTLIVPAAAGLVGNDITQPEADVRAVLVSGPAAGSFLLDADGRGGFRYTAPASNPPSSVTLTYKLRDTWTPIGGGPSPESAAASVLIRIAPCATTITGHPSAPEFVPGGTAAMQVTASGAGRLTYQWRLNGADLADDGRVAGAATATLVISGLSEADRGVYTCLVAGACGQAESDPAYLGASPCPADFNRDGGIDGGDVEAFFAAWENGDQAADVNFDGGIDGGDVETFFAAWENGGC
jgi:hypothetical protein